LKMLLTISHFSGYRLTMQKIVQGQKWKYHMHCNHGEKLAPMKSRET
jgi:hypothetical protein